MDRRQLGGTKRLIWPFQRWAIASRAKRSLGSSTDVTFTSAGISIGSAAGSYQQPWSRFVSTEVDAANLYLFVSAINAITIPRKDVPVEAMEFAMDHVGEARSAPLRLT